MRCAMEMKGVTFNTKLRFIQIMGRYDRCTNLCQASVTDPKLHDHDLHPPDGAEDCYISTPCTSLIMWKVFVHQASKPICSTRQAVHHSYFNLLGKPGSRIWVKFRKPEFFFHKHDWSLWRWQQALASLGWENFGPMLPITEACQYHYYQQKNKKHLVPLQGYEKFQMDV